MILDLWCIVVLALWGPVFAYVPVLGRIKKAGVGPGLHWGFSNRDGELPGAPWVQRADRAYANHLANLPLFIGIAGVSYVSGRNDSVTATCCVVFVAARILHSIAYTLGVPYVRSVLYWVGLGALVVIVSRLFLPL